VIIDAVRSTSPRTSQFGQPRESEHERDRERSTDTTARGRRGRTMERHSESVNLNVARDDLEEDSRHMKEKGRGLISMMLGGRDRGGAAAEGWKEFKKGVR